LTKHGLSYGDANAIASRALQSADGQAPTGDDLVDTQYAGAKSVLKPIYEELILAVESFGPDVEIAPKKGYVSLRRSKQFGLIQPTTATRIDVGIQLKGTAPTARLEASGSFNAMVSHRVRIGAVKEVDPELTDWLRAAYDAA
jgi:hypothetical protein